MTPQDQEISKKLVLLNRAIGYCLHKEPKVSYEDLVKVIGDECGEELVSFLDKYKKEIL